MKNILIFTVIITAILILIETFTGTLDQVSTYIETPVFIYPLMFFIMILIRFTTIGSLHYNGYLEADE